MAELDLDQEAALRGYSLATEMSDSSSIGMVFRLPS
jgi:hypothetical protein